MLRSVQHFVIEVGNAMTACAQTRNAWICLRRHSKGCRASHTTTCRGLPDWQARITLDINDMDRELVPCRAEKLLGT